MSGSTVVDLSGNDARVDDVLDEALGVDKSADKVDDAADKADDVKPVKEFKAPQTQEEFDRAVQKRIQRVEDKYKDYDALKAQAEKADALEAEKGSDIEKATRRAEKSEKDFADLQVLIAKRDRDDLVRDVAEELGLPSKLRTRVQGDDEKAIRADIAELLEGLPAVDPSVKAPPVAGPKTKVKVSAGSGDGDPEWTSDDLVKAIGRGGLVF